MKKEETLSHTWLTPSMSASGLSERVLAHMSGKELDGTTLSYEEFFLLWSIKEESFIKMSMFKQWMSAHIKEDKPLSEELVVFVHKNSEAKDLLFEHLSIEQALSISTTFREYRLLFNRASSRAERIKILFHINNLVEEIEFDTRMLLNYYKISRKHSQYRSIAYALISAHILRYPTEGFDISKEISLTKNQISGMLRKMKEESLEPSFDTLLKFYLRTKDANVLQMIQESVTEQSDRDYFSLQDLNDLIHPLKGENREEMVAFLFPISSIFLQRIKLESANSLKQEILSLLPVYDRDDSSINAILKRIHDWYEDKKYPFPSEVFLVWYGYAPKEYWTDLYMKGITKYESRDFSGAQKVFKLSNDELVIDAIIREGIPRLKNLDEDFIEFMNWLKPQKNSWYSTAKDIILSGNLLEKWWDPKWKPQKFLQFVQKHF